MTESTNKLNLMIKRHNKQMVEINNFAKTTSKILDAFYEMKEISQNERRNKLKEVITVINVTLDSSSNAESLNYLIGLKDKNHNDIVNAKIEKNEFKRVLSQEILD